MATGPEKVRENRLRRAAKRQGLELHKSRTRDPRALDYGRWWLTSAATGDTVAGGGDERWDLQQVERYLTG
ncbi:MAG: hypothetical protein JW895_02855 [Thermoleophilaceae bacterium]|nr:hypothetical protein [Thermoleophilaceae bacterium]